MARAELTRDLPSRGFIQPVVVRGICLCSFRGKFKNKMRLRGAALAVRYISAAAVCCRRIPYSDFGNT